MSIKKLRKIYGDNFVKVGIKFVRKAKSSRASAYWSYGDILEEGVWRIIGDFSPQRKGELRTVFICTEQVFQKVENENS